MYTHIHIYIQIFGNRPCSAPGCLAPASALSAGVQNRNKQESSTVGVFKLVIVIIMRVEVIQVM